MLFNHQNESINLDHVVNAEISVPPVEKDENDTPIDSGADITVYLTSGAAKAYHYDTRDDARMAFDQLNSAMDAQISAAQGFLTATATARALGPALRMVGVL